MQQGFSFYGKLCRAQVLTDFDSLSWDFCFYCFGVAEGLVADAGRPNNWVPLISAQTINDVIKPLLSALQTVENVYVKGYLQKAKDKITKLELQDYISQSVATSSKYEDQIGALQRQYTDTVATFNELAAKRSAAATTLQNAGASFQKEIASKLRLDAFLTGLQAIGSIVTGSVPNLIQIGDTLSELRKSQSMPFDPASALANPAVSASVRTQQQSWC